MYNYVKSIINRTATNNLQLSTEGTAVSVKI